MGIRRWDRAAFLSLFVVVASAACSHAAARPAGEGGSTGTGPSGPSGAGGGLVEEGGPSDAPSDGDGNGGVVLATFHFAPSPVPATTPIPNPTAGLYDWYGTTSSARAPGVTSPDEYYRFSWADLETTQGTYDFSPIDAQISALSPGQRLSFRVMPLNSCYSGHGGVDVPAYLQTGKGWTAPSSGAASAGCGNKTVYVPDWNSTAYLTAVKNLVAALGAKYDADPHIGWIDIGLEGDWGEWHVSEFPYCDSNYNKMAADIPSAATYQAIIDAHVAAFPHKQLLMVMGGNESISYALSLTTAIPIGFKRDSWGAPLFTQIATIDQEALPSGGPTPGGQCAMAWTSLSTSDLAAFTSRWMTAPFIAESYGGSEGLAVGDQGIVEEVQTCHVSGVGNGSWNVAWASLASSDQQAFLASGIAAGYRVTIPAVDVAVGATSMSLATTWVNDGDAPPYEPWSVGFSLYDVAASKVAAQVTSAVKLSSLLPSVSYGSCGSPLDAGAAPQMTAQTISDALPLSGVAPGTYDLRVQITHPSGYLAPMALAIGGRNADGSYSIGSVVLP